MSATLELVDRLHVSDRTLRRAVARGLLRGVRDSPTRKSSNETCPTEGGTIQSHTYDEANRLTDEGVTYEEFGNTTKLPATDAGQYELTGSYCVDGQVASQTQDEKTIAYGYDPEGRTRETKTTVKTKSEPTVISHYAAPGGAVAWTSEEGKAWTRDIPGIDGTLSATHSSSGTTELQLHDLKGNIVATASLSETETKLLKTYNSTEFGVPTEGKEPPKYAWLGSDGVTSELPSGAIAKDGKTYVPLTGESLQTQPVELPIPDNAAEPYEGPNAEGAIVGPMSVAQDNAAYWEAIHAAEAADGDGHNFVGHSLAFEINNGTAGVGAIAAFDREFRIPSASAIAMGGAMVSTGSDPNALQMILYGIPSWAFTFLEHITSHNVRNVGAALVQAGTESIGTPEPYVTIKVTGSVKHGHYGIQILWLGINYYEP